MCARTCAHTYTHGRHGRVFTEARLSLSRHRQGGWAGPWGPDVKRLLLRWQWAPPTPPGHTQPLSQLSRQPPGCMMSPAANHLPLWPGALAGGDASLDSPSPRHGSHREPAVAAEWSGGGGRVGARHGQKLHPTWVLSLHGDDCDPSPKPPTPITRPGGVGGVRERGQLHSSLVQFPTSSSGWAWERWSWQACPRRLLELGAWEHQMLPQAVLYIPHP